MSLALKEAREAASSRLLEIADLADTRSLTDDERAEIKELKTKIADVDERTNLATDAAAIRAAAPSVNEAPKVDAAVRAVVANQGGSTTPLEVKDREVYTRENRGASFMRDMATLRDRDASNADVGEARGRLEQHYRAEGKETEVRALASTTDSTGGYLVAPAYLQNEFIELLAAGRPTANLCTSVPLPPKTDSINIPTMDGATAVAVHTENGAVTETSATFNTVPATVVRIAGMNKIPNFLLDRSLPGVDGIIMKDLAARVGVKVNADVLNGTTPEGILNADGVGTATATGGTATATVVYQAIINAITDVRTGVYAEPSHIVMHPRRWGWLLQQMDSGGRPFIGAIMPLNGLATHNGGAPEGFQAPGSRVAGNILGIPVILDAGMPVTLGAGTDEDAIIVGKFDEAWLLEAAPKFAVSNDAYFGTDQSVARVTLDYAFTAERRPAAFSLITGTALNDALV